VTELESSSAAAATVPTCSTRSAMPALTVAARAEASLAVEVMDCAVDCMHWRGRRPSGRYRDAALEVSGETFHRRAALGGGTCLVSASDFSNSRMRNRIVLEDLDGRGHLADLVATADAGYIALTALPSASAFMRLPSWPSGLEMLRPIIQACCPRSRRMPRMARPSKPGDRLQLGIDVVE